MSAIDQDSVYTSLLQTGPFAVTDSVQLAEYFSSTTKRWVKKLKRNPNNVAEYRAIRNQIFDFLDINSFQEIATLLDDIPLQEARSARAHYRLGNMFGLTGTDREIEARVQEYARTADAVVNSLKTRIFRSFASHIATTNEIEVMNDPVKLLLITFDDRYHKKARFEARRKLVLMNIAGSIDQRERETEIEEKFLSFLFFLNKFVWSKKQKIGEHDIVYLLSQHDHTDFKCHKVDLLHPDEMAAVNLEPGMKLTLLKRRLFEVGAKSIPIYVSIRKKPQEAKVIKLLRKNEKNPAVAVDDELGLMAVLDSIADIKAFLNHLTRSASRADSFLVLEDISDTLTEDSEYRATSTGSSSKTAMLKFFARLGGMRVEFIIHTNQTWLNYMYQQDVAHDEYEVKRIFDTGVAELLFPRDIFHLDHQAIRESILKRLRQQIEKI